MSSDGLTKRPSKFTLFYNPYSICSLQVLYTLALRGEPKDAESQMEVDPQIVDIFNMEQLSEEFLCEVNAEGQVPVLLSSTALESPMPDSLRMTLYMSTRYPELIPAAQDPQIRKLLVELHALNYFSLSFPTRPQIAKGFEAAILARLEQPDITDRYRKALEFKLDIVRRNKIGGLVPTEMAKNEQKAKDLLATVSALLPESPSQWIYGSKPTALDAHLVVFIARPTGLLQVDDTNRNHASTSTMLTNVEEACPFQVTAEPALPSNNYALDGRSDRIGPFYSSAAMQLPEAGSSTAPSTSIPVLDQDSQQEHGVLSQTQPPTDSELYPSNFPPGPSMNFYCEPDGLLWEDVDLNSWFLEPFFAPDEPPLRPTQSTATETNTQHSRGPSPSPTDTIEIAAIVEQLWFTKLGNDVQDLSNLYPHHSTATTGPRAVHADREDLNEGYRLSLSNRLRANYSEDPLPSTDFLWDVITATHAEEKIPIVQSALIGQLFMMVSGRPRHLAIGSAFHGTLVSWTRRAELMDVKHEHIDLDDLSEAQLANTWRRWARKEELIRTALAVFIQDAELVALFHHEPILRFGGKGLPIASSSEAFSAPTASSWLEVMREEPAQRRCQGGVVGTAAPSLRYQLPNAACAHSEFSAYFILECIGATICEDRVGGAFSSAKVQKYETDLISWYVVFGKKLQAEYDPQCLLLLWHWTFISNLVDLNRLELAVGKRGVAMAAACADYVDEWASSAASKRCLVHAHLLQKNMENKCMRRPLAIHVPRCLFSAAICWATFLGSNAKALDIEASLDDVDFPELRILGVHLPRHWSDTIGAGTTSLLTVKGTTLCSLAELLRQVGHWEIARRFSRILRPLIHGIGDEALLTR
ncbi:hypothetical protein H2200_007376 [Cladophialophora chaetospira]|uniref:GST N-terminal domain-containing protein n=1 Tax=Cladophialophora chaetospira TaxID=386627 RepID=A0AA38X7U8_9EURO|nr:hypothetical protein H2200_007376 [Cladophialophora chaetospira]